MIELAVYVSGHGFGHATRTAEVLRAVRERRPSTRMAVATAAPERLFRAPAGEPLLYRALQCDVGLVQRDALEIDEAGTEAAVDAFARGYPALVAQEASWLRAQRVRLVLGDLPPLAFAAAAAAGVPALGLGNFSWDWIYGHLAARRPGLLAAARAAADAYAHCALLLVLPFAGDLSAFPRREAIPLLARHARVPRGAARRRLGWAEGETVVLLSFGGIGVELDRAPLAAAPFRLVFSDDVAPGLGAHGLGYEDLVAAADVVVSKPGYGIVSDLAAARGRLVYTERGDFPEYPIMVREMPRYLPAVHLSNADLVQGRLAGAVRDVLALPLPPAPDSSGAAVAAQHILERLERP
jgi:hypothetical protein